MLETLTLCFFAFLAGFINGTVGGGGLVQTPALLIILPDVPVPKIMGTAKFSSITGSVASAIQYSRRIKFDEYGILLTVVFCAFWGSLGGARLISYLNPSLLKPVIWFLLVFVFIFVSVKKDFGQTEIEKKTSKLIYVYSGVFGGVIGLYDGFFGPGTGTFLILFFVVVLGYEFLKAAAYSKIVNVTTNFAALLEFVSSGNLLIEFALPMAACNVLGAYVGVRAVLLKGNAFVRVLFLGIIALMILRFGYDIFLR
jgi:uncharacterized protein